MASTRYGKVSDDLELSTRSRNPQVRDVTWLPPDQDDPRGAQDLQAKALLIIRRMTLAQKVCAGIGLLVVLIWALSPSSSLETELKSPSHGSFRSGGMIVEVVRDSPIYATERDGSGIKLDSVIGQVFAGHLLEAGPSIVFHGSKYTLLDKGGAIQAGSVKLADPQDAARFRSETLAQQETMLAEDFDHAAIVPGTALQVVENGPIYDVDENGVVWGAEIGEVIQGQIVHAAGAPVVEDGHTTVSLQTGGALDVSLVQVAELQHAEEYSQELHEGQPQPQGHSEGFEHGEPQGEPAFEGEGHEAEGFAGHEGQEFEGHPGFESHEGQEFEGHHEFEGHEGQELEGHHEFEGHEGQELEGHPGSEGHEGQGLEGHEGFASPEGQEMEGHGGFEGQGQGFEGEAQPQGQEGPMHEGFVEHEEPHEFQHPPGEPGGEPGEPGEVGEPAEGAFEGGAKFPPAEGEPGEPTAEHVEPQQDMQEPGAEPEPGAEVEHEGGVG